MWVTRCVGSVYKMPSRLGSIHAHLAAPAGAGGAVLEEPAVEMSEREKFLMDLNGYVRDPPPCLLDGARPLAPGRPR